MSRADAFAHSAGQADRFRTLAGIALAGLAVLLMTAAFVVNQFDTVAYETQFQIARQNYHTRIVHIARAIAPLTTSAETAQHLTDPDWIDQHLARHLASEHEMERLFVLDAQGQPIYAATDGQRTKLADYHPFARAVSDVLPVLSAAHAQKSSVMGSNILRHDGQLYLLTITGTGPPGGATIITGLPFDDAMLRKFGLRHLADELTITDNPMPEKGYHLLPLADAQGKVIAAIRWKQQSPAAMVFGRLRMTLAAAGAIVLLVGFLLLRQSAAIARHLIASEAQARYLALHDALTGLPNRTLLLERLANWQAIARDMPVGIALHCLDLDRFKDVNDTLGHPSGDELIRAVADRLVTLCREGDTVARMGGDEFIILQPQADASAAMLLAEQVLEALRQPFQLDAGTTSIACSIGIALVHDSKADAADMLRQADLALYQSKERGRNRATFFEPEMDAALRLRRRMEQDLRDAINLGQLHMVYQPQVDEKRRLVGMEALIRWDHPERGPIGPTLFVPLAEEAGMMAELGEFTLRTVFQETADWRGAPVGINVSALQLRTPAFMATVTRLVAEYCIDPAQYQIEITETAMLGQDGATRDNIDVLAQEGFSIALDDFGTGFSSLSSLHRFAIDKIKIDRSFVRNLDAGDVDNRKLINAIIRLGRAMDLEVIAEGVETERQHSLLVMAGCTRFQGYLYGRPVPAAQMLERFQAG
ncbi:putative bifunctional diguanylate cyclase/phosphodiesterase [Novosphingobium rosa]|uniref:putative bifunctional diguanylate cyclase/phosphodiesterase n=1 Tax=Novosphingobium rosa TaxID=76978 RepID=UPI0008318A5A|nr:EAL domain-containing protein [Novosphingobium rosa]